MRWVRLAIAGSMGAGAFCACHGTPEANKTARTNTRIRETFLTMSPILPPYCELPGARNSQLSSRCVGQ